MVPEVIMDDGPTIPEFFRGSSVFITGATGFMGKVLVEKLLRSCPDIGRVYIMLRGKKGKTPEERLRTIFDIPLFERLHDEQPGATDKVVGMTGDMMELGLGLSQEDTKTLQEKVSVVFHVAATVKFDDPIKSAVFMNVRGTREVAELATKMPKLKVFVHVSTTYCNTDKTVVDEVIYPPPGDWRKMITAAETLEEHTLQILTAKILGIRPNTYTYTKALGEHVIKDYSHQLPSVIFRPSIVISSLEEPVPGWMDNFNGPVGLMVAGGKGILRTIYAKHDNTSDYMAVDIAIKAMIVAAWWTGKKPHTREIPVYNCSSSNIKGLSIGEVSKKGHELGTRIPLNNVMWKPGGDVSEYFVTYYIKVMLYHILPAVFIDMLLYALNMQPMLVRLQRRIYIANTALEYFLHHEWYFINDRLLELEKRVLDRDRKDWDFDFQNISIPDYMLVAFIGGRQYLMKEDYSTLPQAKIHFNRMWWLDRIVRTILGVWLLWKVYSSSLLQRAFVFLTGYVYSFVVLPFTNLGDISLNDQF